MERKGATYLVMEAIDKDHVETSLLYFKIYWNSRNTTVYHTLQQTHYVITQFLQPEAEQLLLFRILLASVVLTTFFLKRSAACSWQLQAAIEQKYWYKIEILKCSSNVRHIWGKILTPCTHCSWRWSQFRIQFLIHVMGMILAQDNGMFMLSKIQKNVFLWKRCELQGPSPVTIHDIFRIHVSFGFWLWKFVYSDVVRYYKWVELFFILQTSLTCYITRHGSRAVCPHFQPYLDCCCLL